MAETILSLVGCNILDVTDATPHSDEALSNQIDLAAVFQTPVIYCFHLPSATSPFVAQVVGRLAVKYLLIAAKAASRTTRVQVVIDEFQRMISDNLDVVFQQARGLDIGVLTANQSLGDLRNVGPVLLNAIEGIVWDATEVVSYKRKHTANVSEALGEMRIILRHLVGKRDERKDAFANSIKLAMATSLGSNVDDATKALSGFGIGVGHIKKAVETMATQPDGFTVFGAVDHHVDS